MSPAWVNGKILKSSHPKADKWNPDPPKEKVLWGLCKSCGATICEGDSVGMVADHEQVICYNCFANGEFTDFHMDCAGLKLPDSTLSQ